MTTQENESVRIFQWLIIIYNSCDKIKQLYDDTLSLGILMCGGVSIKCQCGYLVNVIIQ